MRRLFILGLVLALSACGDGGTRPTPAPPTSEWEAGAPTSRPIGNPFEIPVSGSINYITQRRGSLKGKTRITLRYRVDMDEGVRIFPPSMPAAPSIITLYFQREGDDWSGQGEFETYRWYATSASQMPITAGEHEMTVSLDGGTPNDDPRQPGTSNWTAIQFSSSYLNPNFEAAKEHADRVGFVLGGGTGYGHGVTATGPATLTIESFEVS